MRHSTRCENRADDIEVLRVRQNEVDFQGRFEDFAGRRDGFRDHHSRIVRRRRVDRGEQRRKRVAGGLFERLAARMHGQNNRRESREGRLVDVVSRIGRKLVGCRTKGLVFRTMEGFHADAFCQPREEQQLQLFDVRYYHGRR